MSTTITAAVLHTLSSDFSVQQLCLREPLHDEVLVEIAGSGICHTDIKVSQGYAGVPLPVVLGHEGSGKVLQRGSEAGDIEVGDHVVMSFPSCGCCRQCSTGHPAYCDQGQQLSFSCQPLHGLPAFSNAEVQIHGTFFGQSSFASHALVSRRNLVRVDKQLPLSLLGPLGCGFQTGAGAVLNVLQPASATSIAVFGAGNVGLSAVMAAKIAGMDPVIAIDRNPERLATAIRLGASHVIDSNVDTDLADSILRITSAAGVDYAVDTTNMPAIIRAAFASLANRGTCVHSGGGGKDICIDGSHLLHGRTITGVIQGDSVPAGFIPQLLAYYQAGVFPFDTLLQMYPIERINEAVADMRSGRVIKPVLRFMN